MPLDDLDTPVDDSWRDLLLRGKPKKEGEPPPVIPCVANVITILTHHDQWRGVLAYDEFGEQMVARKPPPWDETECKHPRPGTWTDADDTRLDAWLQRHEQLHVKRAMGPLVDVVARRNAFHPVREWLDRLRWDGVHRSLTAYLDAQGPMAELACRWMLVSAVARIYKPGCKVDTMTILQGDQGLRKSSAMKALYGPEWFSDTPIDLSNKDSYVGLRGKWCIEWAEFETSSRFEQGRIKAFCSSATDHYRDPYGRRARDVPRQCVFVASTNEFEIFKDATGSRRYMPFAVGEGIDLEAIERDREQLWAEAVEAYRAGEKWWAVTAEERELCRDEQEARYDADAWEAVIMRWARTLTRERITIDEVASQALQIDVGRIDKGAQTRIGSILKRRGWRLVRVQEGGVRIRCYVRSGQPSYSGDEVGHLVGHENSSMLPL